MLMLMYLVGIVLNIIRWRNSHIGWVLGEFCGYGGSPDADDGGIADVDSDAAADSDADAAADAVFETFPNTLYAYA